MYRMLNEIGVDFREYNTNHTHAKSLVTPSSFQDRVLARLRGEQNLAGATLPWSKTHQLIRFRPGEVTVWAGINGHGKSMVLNQAMLWMLPADTTAAIASLEMPADTTLARLTRQAAGNSHPSDKFVDRFLHHIDTKLWIYDQIGSVDRATITGVIKYCADELGVTQFVLDSLMKCGIHSDDFRTQKDFVDSLTNIAKDHGIHIHLVAHARKGEDEGKRINKFDIKGAGEITDLTDNVILVWRNKDKERKRQAAEFNPKIEWDEMDPDCVLSVEKQRHGEWEGNINLWFHKDGQQYLPKPTTEAMPWPPQPRDRFSVYEGGIQ